ncbi:jg9616 [Pararge aegeria aegeria]|uniref:Jg9616 protein n=1 Tax=Pararge aegeria aegeria TaxID=348720 RepID=A0A8S4RT90_9NEOP|nr:jg9616 [Pararge aegeria aegeria]
MLLPCGQRVTYSALCRSTTARHVKSTNPHLASVVDCGLNPSHPESRPWPRSGAVMGDDDYDDNYLKSDNLFNKAKSLTDSDEILISDEFSLEDIPEGIPLEDPLYDNLTKRNKNEGTGKLSNIKLSKQNYDVSTEKNNKVNTIIQNYTRRDENEIPKYNEYLTNLSNIVSNHENYNRFSGLNINTNEESEIPEENEYVTDINRPHEVYSNKDINIHDVARLNESAKDDNEIPKENGYMDVINFSVDKNSNSLIDNKNNEHSKSGDIKELENLVTKEINKTIHIQDVSKVSNEVIRDTTQIQGYNQNGAQEEFKVHNTEEKLAVDNPSLTSFHVIDSEKDLDVPTGIEGPIPAIVLPPKNFVAPSDIVLPMNSQSVWRRFPEVPYNPYYYQPFYYKQNYYINYKPVLPPFQ